MINTARRCNGYLVLAIPHYILHGMFHEMFIPPVSTELHGEAYSKYLCHPLLLG